jgi:hypothetical protein
MVVINIVVLMVIMVVIVSATPVVGVAVIMVANRMSHRRLVIEKGLSKNTTSSQT